MDYHGRWTNNRGQVKCPRYFAGQVIVFKLKDVPFPANHIWFFPESRGGFRRTNLEETVPFKLAAKAIGQSVRDRVVEKKSRAAHSAEVFFVALLSISVSVGLVFKVWSTYLEPWLTHRILLFSCIVAIALFQLVSRGVRTWPDTKRKIIVLCLAAIPLSVLISFYRDSTL